MTDFVENSSVIFNNLTCISTQHYYKECFISNSQSINFTHKRHTCVVFYVLLLKTSNIFPPSPFASKLNDALRREERWNTWDRDWSSMVSVLTPGGTYRGETKGPVVCHDGLWNLPAVFVQANALEAIWNLILFTNHFCKGFFLHFFLCCMQICNLKRLFSTGC